VRQQERGRERLARRFEDPYAFLEGVLNKDSDDTNQDFDEDLDESDWESDRGSDKECDCECNCECHRECDDEQVISFEGIEVAHGTDRTTFDIQKRDSMEAPRSSHPRTLEP
jgi:hypothetical protein